MGGHSLDHIIRITGSREGKVTNRGSIVRITGRAKPRIGGHCQDHREGKVRDRGA